MVAGGFCIKNSVCVRFRTLQELFPDKLLLFSHGLYGSAFMRLVINLIEILTDRD